MRKCRSEFGDIKTFKDLFLCHNIPQRTYDALSFELLVATPVAMNFA